MDDDIEEAEALAEELAEATARMASELGWAIGPHRDRESYALAGAPVAVVFERGRGEDAKPQQDRKSTRLNSSH